MTHIDTNTPKGKENLTRRAIIAGLAAAPIAAIPAIAYEKHPDAKLIALDAKQVKQHEIAESAQVASADAADAAHAEYPVRPPSCEVYIQSCRLTQEIGHKQIDDYPWERTMGVGTAKQHRVKLHAQLGRYELPRLRDVNSPLSR